ncbi:hypothetical protein [Methanosarcina horonobensis]|uniref:hypothetical protein n=1 Tax=Methanosarcina horonobensis TaxID=418008 RepID=UPI000A7BEC66|nr:hypothetical protein [Methanosarcina horonobensis]
MQQSPDNENADSQGLPDKNYWLYGLLIVLFALILRLFELGERVFHHDEAYTPVLPSNYLKTENTAMILPITAPFSFILQQPSFISWE